MVSRQPSRIAGLSAAFGKSPSRVQQIVDNAPAASWYCTDGWSGYTDVVYPGHHQRNVHDKSDTFTVEGVNADLRHCIPLFARRSRCFARTVETLYAVIAVYTEDYNRFGMAKHRHRLIRGKALFPLGLVDFL